MYNVWAFIMAPSVQFKKVGLHHDLSINFASSWCIYMYYGVYGVHFWLDSILSWVDDLKCGVVQRVLISWVVIQFDREISHHSAFSTTTCSQSIHVHVCWSPSLSHKHTQSCTTSIYAAHKWPSAVYSVALIFYFVYYCERIGWQFSCCWVNLEGKHCHLSININYCFIYLFIYLFICYLCIYLSIIRGFLFEVGRRTFHPAVYHFRSGTLSL